MRHVSLTAALVAAFVLVGCDTAKVVRESSTHFVVTGTGPAPFCDDACAKERAQRAADAACGDQKANKVNFPTEKSSFRLMFLTELAKTAATAVGTLKGALSLFGTNAYTGLYECG